LYSGELKSQIINLPDNDEIKNPILKETLTQGISTFTLNLSFLENGIYFLDVIVNNKVQRHEILKL